MYELTFFSWPTLALFALIASSPAVAASSLSHHCELEARKAYKRRTTEVEMALIAGSLNEVEVSRARDGLTRRLRLDEEDCSKRAILSKGRRSTRIARSSRGSRKL